MSHYDPEEPTARVSAHEVEVPGSPEQVWEAIATGPGISTWFVPAQVEGREGGRIVTHHGPYGDSEGVVTAWDPPHRFAYDEPGWGPESPAVPTWSTELLVEARDGGTCLVRLTSGFFRGGDGWEEQLEGTDEGWVAALRNLRLALTHFPGRRAASMLVFGRVAGRDPDDVGAELLGRLGLAQAAPGTPVRLGSPLPQVVGSVVETGSRSVCLLVEAPHPGLLELGAFAHEDATAAVRGYFYGPGGDAVAEREAPLWSAWLAGHVEGLEPLG
ncbi:SRPBCC family protein [Motilibacter aurantiacus]|uniref:SRPBCC family protein n=1 Tax=Motilibacter aurantiacus TaxID=2714955 RepID=UPI0014092077|nr:SRPBCC domain-containing protein [Motilibacter aurantiacus]